MTLRFEDIVVDCGDPRRVAEFWSAVFDVPVQPPSDPHEQPAESRIDPPEGAPYMLFIEVPEPKRVKNRLHVDLRPRDQAAEVARLEALGARRIDIGQGDVTWVVLADVEGNEFCVLRSDPAVRLRWENVGFDCADARRVAHFWSAVFSVPLHGADDTQEEPLELWIRPNQPMPELWFNNVPEAKLGKNRVHLDLRPDDQAAEVARLEALGAQRVDIGQRDVTWVVLADVEGNEFCVLQSQPQ